MICYENHDDIYGLFIFAFLLNVILENALRHTKRDAFTLDPFLTAQSILIIYCMTYV